MSAVRATFEDVKRVKTRKAWQLIFEVPEEQYDAAVAALGGSPISGHDRWVGIARITAPDDAAEPQETQTEPEPVYAYQEPDYGSGTTTPAPVKGGPKSIAAGRLCNGPTFQSWLLLSNWGVGHTFAGSWTPGEIAAEIIRIQCGVTSRAELDHNEAAGQIWDRIESDYRAAQSGETLEARERQLQEGPS